MSTPTLLRTYVCSHANHSTVAGELPNFYVLDPEFRCIIAGYNWSYDHDVFIVSTDSVHESFTTIRQLIQSIPSTCMSFLFPKRIADIFPAISALVVGLKVRPLVLTEIVRTASSEELVIEPLPIDVKVVQVTSDPKQLQLHFGLISSLQFIGKVTVYTSKSMLAVDLSADLSYEQSSAIIRFSLGYIYSNVRDLLQPLYCFQTLSGWNIGDSTNGCDIGGSLTIRQSEVVFCIMEGPGVVVPVSNNLPRAFPLFVIAGQSNNAGRSSLDELRQADIDAFDTNRVNYIDFDKGSVSGPYSEKLLFYDPVTRWNSCDATVDIHKNVDILKSTGFGPAISFGCRMIDLLEQHSEQPSTVGLVPVSVGGTYLYEWMPDYFAYADCNDHNAISSRSVSGNSDFAPYMVDEDGYLITPANARYQPGCINLLCCALKSVYNALLSRDDAYIAGIVWYQGENDCTLSNESAASYGNRLHRFLVNFNYNIQLITETIHSQRDMTSSILHIDEKLCQERASICIPMALVAVTTTRPLPNINTIRSQQLQFSQQFSNTVCATNGLTIDYSSSVTIDAFGLLLAKDCIHLTALGAFSLGIAIANQLGSLVTTGNYSCRSTPGSGIYDNFEDQVRVLQHNAAATIGDKLASSTDNHFNLIKHGIKKIRESNLKPVNFVYGEISVEGFCSILRAMGGITDERRLIDLGCGAGRCIASAILLNSLAERQQIAAYSDSPHFIMQVLSKQPVYKTISGIDLMSSKLLECAHVLEQLHFRECSIDGDTRVYRHQVCSPVESIVLHHANILDVDWTNFDTVVICSTCFDDDLMIPLTKQLLLLKPFAKIALLDKQTLSSPECCDHFSLLCSMQCKTSWGTGNAFIYEKN